MPVEISAKLPLTHARIDVMFGSTKAQAQDAAIDMQHQGAEVIRDAQRASPTLRHGPIEQLLDTPSPLDQFSDSKQAQPDGDG